MPAPAGASLQPGEAAVTKVQYYPGYMYGSPLDLPAAVIGGTLGLVTGAFDSGISVTTAHRRTYGRLRSQLRVFRSYDRDLHHL